MHVLLIACALASAACLRQTQYQCEAGSSACGPGGQCESTGYCSFPDGQCSSGRRYHDAAGMYGGRCVEGNVTMDDANMTMPDMPEQMGDAPMADSPPIALCPAGYVQINGGQSGHLYKVVTALGDWGAHRNACAANSPDAYLAIPDDATELQAMDAAMAVPLYWVGVNDLDAEDQWKTVLGTDQTFLPWLPPAPDNQNPGEHCVEAISATHNFNDERCNSNLPALCECGP